MTDALSLFPYQEDGADWLAERRYAFLADEMGLGKTAQVVAACDRILAKKILVVCPGVARQKWLREFDKFSLLGHRGQAILTGKHRPIEEGVTTLSYDLLRNQKIRRAIYDQGPWDVVVADEARALKERGASRTHLFYHKNGLADRAKRVWLLDGTPAPNHYAELWTHLRKFRIYDGDYWSFVSRYCAGFETQYGFKITGGKNTEELKTLIAPFMLRRREQQVLKDLPPLRIGEKYLEPPKQLPEELRLLEGEIRDRVCAVLGHDDTEADLEELVGPQLRRATGLAKVGPTIDAARAFLSRTDRKLVLFGWHPLVLDQIAQGLTEYRPVVVHGRSSGNDNAVTRFAEDPTCRVFCGQIITAGSAIDLVSARDIWLVEADWTPGNNSQVIKRCHRLGQKHPVCAEFLILPGTVDEDIQTAYARKARTLSRLFDR